MDPSNRTRRLAPGWWALPVFVLLAAARLPAQTQGLLLVGSTTGAPGTTVSMPLTLVLNNGVSVDTLGITVVLVPAGSAPASVTGKLSFAPATGISTPSLSTADAGDIVLAWLGNLSATDPKHAVSGTVSLGTLTATIPPAASNGQSYSVQITKLEGDRTSASGPMSPVPLTGVSSAIGPVSTALPLPPVIQPLGILNAASLVVNTPLSPGSISSLFGLNLAATAQRGTAIPPATLLAGTQLLFNGIPAPLFYVSPDQVNFQMPAEISGPTAQVTAVVNGTTSLAASLPVAPVSPGIFTLDNTGSGQGAVLNQDYSINSAQNPAPAGSAIMIYATGLGQTNPPFTTGQPGGTEPPNVTVNTPAVLINGSPAQLLFSGLAPGFPGEYQVNAVIPPGTPSGAAISLQIRIAGQNSNTATIAVR